ncbi:hypothetical protein BGP_6458 [Beggiatoa sp. PS]|nr:hypothetical protein BGP_6458 [Beggiatoa sp. PS]
MKGKIGSKRLKLLTLLLLTVAIIGWFVTGYR